MGAVNLKESSPAATEDISDKKSDVSFLLDAIFVPSFYECILRVHELRCVVGGGSGSWDHMYRGGKGSWEGKEVRVSDTRLFFILSFAFACMALRVAGLGNFVCAVSNGLFLNLMNMLSVS